MKRTHDAISGEKNTLWPGGEVADSLTGNPNSTSTEDTVSNSPGPRMISGSQGPQPTTHAVAQTAIDGGEPTQPVSDHIGSARLDAEAMSNPKITVRIPNGSAGSATSYTVHPVNPASSSASLVVMPVTPDDQFHLGLAALKAKDLNKARHWLSLSAQAGHSAALRWLGPVSVPGDAHGQYQIGLMFEAGIGVEQDVREAAVWYLKAADQDHPIAQTNLGLMYENGNGVEKDAREAVFWYGRAAQLGYACAQTNMGCMYEQGIGVAQDFGLAAVWYRKAADQGYARAQDRLGSMYKNGSGVEKNTVTAVDWYEKAAMKDYASAQTNLAYMYAHGHGVGRNTELAAFWYRKAAENGDAPGQYKLGQMYEFGQYNGPDIIEVGLGRLDLPNNFRRSNRLELAVKWYREAADQGYAIAQFTLGQMYARGQLNSRQVVGWGLDIPKDFESAAFWYRKAADRGHAPAQTHLGRMYENGQGVEKDFNKALFWYRQAVEKGDKPALFDLGRMYASGSGVEKDIVKATYLQMLMGLEGNEDQKAINFFFSESEEVMKCIPDVLMDFQEFKGVTKFIFINKKLNQAEISAIEFFIRSNKSIRSITIMDHSGQHYIDSVQIAHRLADVIQVANTSLTELNFERMHVYPAAERIGKLLGQNKAIGELRSYLQRLPLEPSFELPLDVLRPLADELIVAKIRSGETKEATLAAVNEMLMSVPFVPPPGSAQKVPRRSNS